MTPNDIRSRVVSFAKSVAGLSAAPATYDRYVALIAPAETVFMQRSMSTVSSCGLAVAGIWRAAGYYGAALNAPYEIGSAIYRLLNIAHSLNAWTDFPATPGAAFPSPGDMVFLGGKYEHVYTVVSITTDGANAAIHSVDGGQNVDGYEGISSVTHIWNGNQDTDAFYTRPVVGWIDVTKIVNSPVAPVVGLTMGVQGGMTGVDSDTPITPAVARELVAADISFCVRYLSLGAGRPGDLTAAEAEGIVGAGLSLMAVQHVNSPGWMPSASIGAGHGRYTVQNAQAAGIPMCVSLWLDLEGMSPSATTQDAIDYCTEWYKAVHAAGFTPGLYVGFEEKSSIMPAAELARLPFQHFWKSASDVPAAPFGYQMTQGKTQVIAGITVDVDTTADDARGGRAQLLTGLSPSAPPRPTLWDGSRDPAVKDLQADLNTLGATPPLTVDGNFGPLTLAAVKAFQREKGLTVDGVVGAETWRAIDSALSDKSAA